MATEIRVPNLGESIVEATVGQWFKQAGDTVSAAEPLVELETDKVTVEVPAPASGVLSEIAVKTGETVPVGALLGAISEGQAQSKPAKAKPEAATLSLAAAEATAIVEEPALRAPKPAPTEPKTLEREPMRREEVSAEEMPPSPAARKLIAEAGLSAHDVKGSGRRGQVLKPDVLAARPAAPVTSIAGAAEALLKARAEAEASDPAPRARSRLTMPRARSACA